MTPVEPTLHDGAQLVVFAKDQPEYIPLPASVDNDGLVMTEWEPTEAELDMLLCGGRIRMWLHHAIGANVCSGCGALTKKHLTPMSLEVIAPECRMRES